MKYNNLLNVIAAAAISTLSIPAFAFDVSGPYFGAQAGLSHSSYDLGGIFDDNLDSNGATGRAYVGYQFNQFLGLESGFAVFTNVDLPRDFGDIKTAHWDALLKLGTPIANSGFRIDLKAGAAYIMSDFDANDVATSSGWGDDSDREIKPVAGLSVSYCINKNIAMDASYLHVFGDPQSGILGTPNVDMLTLGISFLIM